MAGSPDRLIQYIEEKRRVIEAALEEYLPEPTEHPALIHESMRYSVFAWGKRLRPVLTLAATEAVGGDVKDALPVAAAVEFVHTYSLVHDDLPCMDDDDYRRGRPTCHKVYGEAMAVLVGDALLTQAFLLLSDGEEIAGLLPARRVALIRELAAAAGSQGMVGGQVVDIQSTDQPVDLATLLNLHSRKTGALIRACLRVGGIVAGASEGVMEILTLYGERVGLAFQIVDDILDLTGKTEELGKTAGKDSSQRKATYPAQVGLEDSRRDVRRLIAEAHTALRPLGEQAWALRGLADYIASRRS